MNRILLFLFLFFTCCTNVEPGVVKVTGGSIKGQVLEDMIVYKGIPFAAPPVGELRWKAPQAVIPWEGVLETIEFGHSPIQTMNFRNNNSEDCLTLNVWSPAQSPKDKLPVMVWIAPGGFSLGMANMVDGANIARKGVLFVSINYRVGAMGFFAHPELSAENEQYLSGNYGLLDQIAGLKWVQENISKFGGDPNNVTIFGESAGGISVSMLCASPLAKGLFHRAISQSGGSFGPIRKEPYSGENMKYLNWAEKNGLKVAEQYGAKSIAELRAIDAAEFAKPGPVTGGFWPIVDGYVIPDDQYRIYESGNFNDVDILVGYNSDEGQSFSSGSDPKSFIEATRKRYDIYTDKLLEAYPITDKEVTKTGRDLGRDSAFGWHTWVWCCLQAPRSDKNVFLYFFDQPLEGTEGSPHGQDVDYVFGSMRRPTYTESDKRLSDLMINYWTNFAKTGDPNGEGLPLWGEFTEDNHCAMYLNGEKPGTIAVPDESSLKVLDEYFAWRRDKDFNAIKAARPTFWANPTGKYTVIADDKLLEEHTVYYPSNLKKEKLPIVVMCGPGVDKTGSAFRPFYTEVASHGYMIIVCGPLTDENENTGVLPKANKNDMLAAIDWAFEQNENADSQFFGKLDTKNVCVMGQSAGGLQALDLKNDPRVSLITMWNSGIFKNDGRPFFRSMMRDKKEAFADLTKPIAYFVGGTDMARQNAEDDFLYIENVPIVVAVRDIPGDAHAGTFRQMNGGAFAQVAVQWFNWQMKGDAKAAKTFVGPDCGLSKDPLWISVQKKNID